MKMNKIFLLLICIFISNIITAQEMEEIEYDEAPAFDSLPTMDIHSYNLSLQDNSTLPNVPRPEMQISVGPAFGIAILEENNTVVFPAGGNNYYIIKSDVTTLLLTAGIDFKARIFFDTTPRYSRGFVIGGRVTAALAGESKGYIDTIYIKEEMAKDEYAVIMDLNFGLTDRIRFTNRFTLIPEYGISFTSIDSGDDDRNEHNYWGVGIFVNVFFQFDITKRMYLEFGINYVYNLFSSQEGRIRNYYYNPYQFVTYEDTGRWGDQISATFSLCVGWRIDLSGTLKGWVN